MYRKKQNKSDNVCDVNSVQLSKKRLQHHNNNKNKEKQKTIYIGSSIHSPPFFTHNVPLHSFPLAEQIWTHWVNGQNCDKFKLLWVVGGTALVAIHSSG